MEMIKTSNGRLLLDANAIVAIERVDKVAPEEPFATIHLGLGHTVFANAEEVEEVIAQWEEYLDDDDYEDPEDESEEFELPGPVIEMDKIETSPDRELLGLILPTTPKRRSKNHE